MPIAASAQLDTVLKNLLQRVAPAVPPASPGYPPAGPPSPYPGYSPERNPPPSPGYTGYPPPPPYQAAGVSDSREVADLQRILSELGYDVGPADGQPGSRTVQAVRAFQRDHGQPATGEITEATVAAVRSMWYEHSRSARAILVAAGPSAVRPSFDCARASNPTERQICASPQLAALDAALSQAFASVGADRSAAARASLMADEQRWLQQRNACGGDAGCIERSINERLAQLRSTAAASGEKLSTTAAGLPTPMSSTANVRTDASPHSVQTPADATNFAAAAAPQTIDLVRLLMAARPDFYKSDPAAVAVYGMSLRDDMQHCMTALKDLENELRRPRVIAEAHRETEAALAAAKRSPTKLFRLSSDVEVGQYDLNSKAFPLTSSDPQSLLGGHTIVTPGDRVEGSCHLELQLGAAGMGITAAASLNPQLPVYGGDRIKSLPMALPAAEALLDRGRHVTIEALVEGTASETGLAGTVVAARAIDSRTHAVLHVYEPTLFGRSQSAAAQSTTSVGQPAGAIDFASVPVADLRNLLALRMATQPANYSDDDFALFWKTLNTSPGTPECDQMRAASRNEIRRAAILLGARQELAEGLASAKASTPQLLRFSNPANLRQYDLQSRGFPLEALGGYESPGSVLPPLQQLTFKAPQRICASGLGREKGVTVSFEGGEKIKQLPMDPDAAEARLSSNNGWPRTVSLEIVAQMSDGAQGLRGRIITARAIDKDSGKVLHVYDPALFGESGAAAASAGEHKTGAAAPVPATRGVLLFEGLRYAPGQIDDKALAQMTRLQAQSDQGAYQMAGSAGSGGREHVFVFGLDEVRDRAIDFVAPMLAGKMRAFLDKTAAQSPETLWTSHNLFGLQYDHAAQMFRLTSGTQILQPYSISNGANLLPLSPFAKDSPPQGSSEAEERAVYAIEPIDGSVPLTGFDNVFRSLRLENTLVPRLVGLDRVLDIEGIPVDPKQAERVVSDLSHRAHASDNAQARVVMHIEGAAAAPKGAGTGVVLLARLESVAILDNKGQEFARFPAEVFPLAADRAHPMKKADADTAVAAGAQAKQQAAMSEAALKEITTTAVVGADRKPAEDVRNTALAGSPNETSAPNVKFSEWMSADQYQKYFDQMSGEHPIIVEGRSSNGVRKFRAKFLPNEPGASYWSHHNALPEFISRRNAELTAQGYMLAYQQTAHDAAGTFVQAIWMRR